MRSLRALNPISKKQESDGDIPSARASHWDLSVVAKRWSEVLLALIAMLVGAMTAYYDLHTRVVLVEQRIEQAIQIDSAANTVLRQRIERLEDRIHGTLPRNGGINE